MGGVCCCKIIQWTKRNGANPCWHKGVCVWRGGGVLCCLWVCKCWKRVYVLCTFFPSSLLICESCCSCFRSELRAWINILNLSAIFKRWTFECSGPRPVAQQEPRTRKIRTITKKNVTLGRRLLTCALKVDCKKGIKSTFPKGKNETKAEIFNLVVHYLVTITSPGCP